MSPGDVVLVSIPQFGGGPAKLRPALLLAMLPGPYQNLLICGISTQLHALVPNWDESIPADDPDFKPSGLRHPSVVRLSYLYAASAGEVAGAIGRIAPDRLARLRGRLIAQLNA
ncbi:MAG TPA: type II toxin-antitoxin system PemK/MazF family toxin [Tepidisphaeraceae bacterium]|nr:type II toxin-antitoxin system PemK/MazF family toxin [Tepidisphaeraceae bacterium]